MVAVMFAVAGEEPRILTCIKLPCHQDIALWREFKANCLWQIKRMQQVVVGDIYNVYSGTKRGQLSQA